MSNAFGFEEMPLPENGLRDVRRRAQRIAMRDRMVKVWQTIGAVAAACIAALSLSLVGPSALTEMATTAGGTATESAAPPPPAPTAAPESYSTNRGGVQMTPDTGFIGADVSASPASPETSGYSAAALGAVLMLASVRLILAGTKAAVPSSRVGWWRIVLLAMSTALTLYGLALIFSLLP